MAWHVAKKRIRYTQIDFYADSFDCLIQHLISLAFNNIIKVLTLISP